MTDIRIDGQQNVPQAQQKLADATQKGAKQPAAFPKAESKTAEEKFEASGLAITKEDVKKAQKEKHTGRTSAKSKERVAAKYNEFVAKFIELCGNNEKLLKKYVTKLPKAIHGGDLVAFENICNTRLAELEAELRADRHEQNSQDRHVESKVAADKRQGETLRTIIDVGEAAIERFDAAKDEIVQVVHDNGDKTIKQIVDTGDNTVRRVNSNTNNAVADETIRLSCCTFSIKDDIKKSIDQKTNELKAQIKKETDRAIEANEAEHKETRKEIKLNYREQNELNNKRQKFSNTLKEADDFTIQGLCHKFIHTEEEKNKIDSTEWFNSIADRVINNPYHDFATKNEAFDELIRMAKSKEFISDRKIRDFEFKYLQQHE